MSGGWSDLALGTVGAGCGAAGLILWLAPRGTASKAAACAAAGLGLTGFLRGTGLDESERNIGRSIGAWMDSLRDKPGELLIPLVLIMISMAVFALSLGASCCWFMEAVEAKLKGESRRTWVLACASIGAFGWAMTVVYLWGVLDQLWATDLFAAAPPQGLVEGILTVLDMAGLVASFAAPSSRWNEFIRAGE